MGRKQTFLLNYGIRAKGDRRREEKTREESGFVRWYEHAQTTIHMNTWVWGSFVSVETAPTLTGGFLGGPITHRDMEATGRLE